MSTGGEIAPPRIAILTGPTGVGKTAVSLALARFMPLRVISADSMQVYRRMDIGTAKPSPDQRARVLHYGIDLADPDHPFTVAEYLEAARPAIDETIEAGDLPLVLGGTRLYLAALAGSFDAGPPPAPEIRKRLTELAREWGAGSLHQWLAEVDRASAESLHPNDTRRVIRALEVFETTGRPLSAIHAASRTGVGEHHALWIALVGSREKLYRSVEARTEVMLQEGWLGEVEGLLRDGYGPYLEQIKAHGYRELAAVIEGRQDLPVAVERINRNVRHFVRYQLGWIRNTAGIARVDTDAGPEATVEAVLAALRPLAATPAL